MKAYLCIVFLGTLAVAAAAPAEVGPTEVRRSEVVPAEVKPAAVNPTEEPRDKRGLLLADYAFPAAGARAAFLPGYNTFYRANYGYGFPVNTYSSALPLYGYSNGLDGYGYGLNAFL